MANYGFLIDQSKCIGCHACSTACKAENQVPLGVYRTWVKYVETGAYPDVRRHFQVTRCNHCANPPCVRICPVTAMYQRSDGIVEFDPSICIGCKSCMQACPYDAVYLDPETNAAAKCTFCAHRIEVGLEPACVVVCPEHAILAGDMEDPASELSKKLATSQATVLKPEQGTGPKLFYINGNDWSNHPTAASATNTFLWADKITEQNISGYERSALELPVLRSKSGASIRTPQEQGHPQNGPIQIGGRVSEHMVQTAYNAQHKIQWRWQLPAYLVTKSISGGLFMLLSLGAGLGLFSFDPLTFLTTGFVAMVFMLLTTILLIEDLSQPKRFLNILQHPQWKSWVARGAYIMVLFTVVAGLWWLIEAGAYLGLLPAGLTASIRPVAALLTFPFALGVVVYTAFLLGQAEGRDMWQSSLLPFQLLSQSFLVGSAVFSALGSLTGFPNGLINFLQVVFLSSLIINLALTLAGKIMPFATEVAMLGSREMTHGRYRNHFWWGGLGLGHAVPLVLFWFVSLSIASSGTWAYLPIALASITGLFFYEYAFSMAPQQIPNS
jgi:Fe-S-cluster-containing dehydrogenase component/formate-dependent nitrite reductase membrane component NrfD